MPVCQQVHIFRQAARSLIVTNAHRVNRGEAGVARLNELLQEAGNPPSERKPELARGSRRFRAGDRVMQLVHEGGLEHVDHPHLAVLPHS